jgi:hypothetical protein
VTQAQLGVGTFAMPLPVRVTTVAGVVDTVVWNDAALQSYRIAVPGEVTAVALDPDGWILCEKAAVPLAGTAAPDAPPAAPPRLTCAPNPFNPETEVAIVIAAAGRVDLAVHDVAGRLVAALCAGDLPAGEHRFRWRGRDDAGRAVASGTYYLRLRTPAGAPALRPVAWCVEASSHGVLGLAAPAPRPAPTDRARPAPPGLARPSVTERSSTSAWRPRGRRDGLVPSPSGCARRRQSGGHLDPNLEAVVALLPDLGGARGRQHGEPPTGCAPAGAFLAVGTATWRDPRLGDPGGAKLRGVPVRAAALRDSLKRVACRTPAVPTARARPWSWWAATRPAACCATCTRPAAAPSGRIARAGRRPRDPRATLLPDALAGGGVAPGPGGGR